MINPTRPINYEKFIAEQIADIKKVAGDSHVLCAMSGGVDSVVAATLVHKAIGNKLTCMLVDHGLMRKNECTEIMQVFKEERGMNLIKIDAEDRFLTKLKNVTEPEKKRKIIGNEFIELFQDEGAKLEKFSFLVQGTIYPDVIESKGVKTHHNVGGLPEKMGLKLIEPLYYLYKNEVRELGLALGLPKNIVMRQPFPGPGLGVRVIGELTKPKLDVLRDADFVVRDEIAKAKLDTEIWQYFAVLTDTKSTGVTNGERTYGYTVAIRAVTSINAMTAGVYPIPYDVLAKISEKITAIPEINRVVYDITPKPPGTIEWE